MNVILALGFLAGLGMLAWGFSGVITGKIFTKAYGIVDGKRIYYRFVPRDKEPIWFWTLCCVYIGVGAMVLTIVFIFTRISAVSV